MRDSEVNSVLTNNFESGWTKLWTNKSQAVNKGEEAVILIPSVDFPFPMDLSYRI